MSQHVRKLAAGATRLYRFPALGQSGEEARSQQEEFEYGYQQGLEQGQAEGYQAGYQQGLASGLFEGEAKGLQQGQVRGLAQGWPRDVPPSMRPWCPLQRCSSSGNP
ncbi:hypothetical protein ACSZN5_05750 [Aeromonas caviae]